MSFIQSFNKHFLSTYYVLGDTKWARQGPCPQGADVLVRETDGKGVFTDWPASSEPRPPRELLPSAPPLDWAWCAPFEKGRLGRGRRQLFKARSAKWPRGDSDPPAPRSPGPPAMPPGLRARVFGDRAFRKSRLEPGSSHWGRRAILEHRQGQRPAPWGRAPRWASCRLGSAPLLP